MKFFGPSTWWMCGGLAIVSMACAERDFDRNTGRSGLSQETSSIDGVELGESSDDAKAEWNDETNEPVMVGGGFLACFIDESAVNTDGEQDGLPIGCSLYAGNDYRQRLNAQLVDIIEAELVLANSERQSVDFVKADNHPRWSWRSNLPRGQENYDLVLAIIDQQNRGKLPKLTIRVRDSLPPAIIENSLVPEAEYKFRLSGTDLCISGNPVWSFSDGSAETDEMNLQTCESALSFRLSPWLDGYRIHTFNPAPFACEAGNYHQDFCGRSCLDLEDFGQGEDLQLFGCTFSEPAQLARFSVVNDRSVYLTFNNRFLVIDEGELNVTNSADGKSHFEILSSRTSVIE
ncbi:MAG: hypothetical protein ACOH5I_18680 [Oligoflexus sp.]